MGPSATICYVPCFLILNMLTVDKLNTRVTYSEPIMTAPLSGHVTSTITFMQRPTDIYFALMPDYKSLWSALSSLNLGSMRVVLHWYYQVSVRGQILRFLFLITAGTWHSR